MTLFLRTDTSRPGGGFALLEGSGLAGLTAITIENVSSGQFLGENGKWGRVAFAFPVDAGPDGSLLLGPHVVDLVPTDLLVELGAENGAALGKLFWADVIPSRNPGSVTSAQVLAERRRRAEEQAAREQAAREQALERQAAEARAAEQQAVAEAAAREQAEQARAEQVRRQQEQAARVAAEAVLAADVAAKIAANEAAAKEAAAKETAEAERRRAAERAKIEADRVEADRTAAALAAGKTRPEPARRRARWPLVAALLLLPVAAAATVAVLRPGLLDGLRHRSTRSAGEAPARTLPEVTDPGPVVARKPRATATVDRNTEPEPSPEPTPQPVPPVSCSTFSARLSVLGSRPDGDKVRLGEDALRAGCGSEAFLAFDAADPQTSEATAWNLARFYDPNEHDPVYRRAASIHADYAAAYYRLWRDRSSRQALALAKICAVERSASLARSCGR